MPKPKKRSAPKTGTTFEKQYRGKRYKMKVRESAGRTVYGLGGQTFETPTAAAKSITKHEVNGWTFWGIDSLGSFGRKGRPRSVRITQI